MTIENIDLPLNPPLLIADVSSSTLNKKITKFEITKKWIQEQNFKLTETPAFLPNQC